LPQKTAASTKDDLAKLVRISDLIVLGHLEKSLPDSGNQTRPDYTIVDADVIWGDPLVYLFPQRDMDDPIQFRTGDREAHELDLMADQGKTMIWFLRRSEDNSSLPQYFGVISARKENRVRKYLADNRVILRHAISGSAGGVELILRNATDSDLHVPEIEVKGQIIWHSPGVSLTVHLLDGDGNKAGSIEPLPGQVKLLDAQDWLLLQPGGEQIIRFDISDYYPLASDQAYSIDIIFDEIGSSSLVRGQLPPKSHK